MLRPRDVMPLICFASPKGGVGKTTLAANVACELERAGKEVVALDVDPQNALRLPKVYSKPRAAGSTVDATGGVGEEPLLQISEWCTRKPRADIVEKGWCPEASIDIGQILEPEQSV